MELRSDGRVEILPLSRRPGANGCQRDETDVRKIDNPPLKHSLAPNFVLHVHHIQAELIPDANEVIIPVFTYLISTDADSAPSNYDTKKIGLDQTGRG